MRETRHNPVRLSEGGFRRGMADDLGYSPAARLAHLLVLMDDRFSLLVPTTGVSA